MRTPGWLASVFRFLRPIVLISLGIFALVGLVCWFGGWWTARDYGNGLMIAGVVALVVGLLSVFGGWGLTRDSSYMYARSAGEDTIVERTNRDLKDVVRSYGFSIRMVIVAVVAYASGLAIKAIFG